MTICLFSQAEDTSGKEERPASDYDNTQTQLAEPRSVKGQIVKETPT